MNAVRSIPAVHLNAGRNFGLAPGADRLRACSTRRSLPQLIVGLRITLGIAWLVVVAAEMIAVNSGLGFLIVDARNAGNRYDLVVAGMVLIGVDRPAARLGMRSLERFNRSAGDTRRISVASQDASRSPTATAADSQARASSTSA